MHASVSTCMKELLVMNSEVVIPAHTRCCFRIPEGESMGRPLRGAPHGRGCGRREAPRPVITEARSRGRNSARAAPRQEPDTSVVVSLPRTPSSFTASKDLQVNTSCTSKKEIDNEGIFCPIQCFHIPEENTCSGIVLCSQKSLCCSHTPIVTSLNTAW